METTLPVAMNQPSFSTPSQWCDHADELAKRGDSKGALAAYTEALRHDASLVRALVGRGILSYHDHSWDKAVADFTLALRLEPDNVSARINRANAFHQRGNTERAIEDYTHALNVDPSNWQAFLGRSLAFSALGQHHNAEHDQRMASELAEERGIDL
ncbi:hypothetical protein IAD21_01057 [Abditibacteriota bacterium]|nr:hypothetical protein IAD21_01057 [Abditibacteriota bacterium]